MMHFVNPVYRIATSFVDFLVIVQTKYNLKLQKLECSTYKRENRDQKFKSADAEQKAASLDNWQQLAQRKRRKKNRRKWQTI